MQIRNTSQQQSRDVGMSGKNEKFQRTAGRNARKTN